MFQKEPAVILGAVQAIIALAVGFGLDWSADQVALIVAATAAVLALVTRSVVTSPETMRRRAESENNRLAENRRQQL